MAPTGGYISFTAALIRLLVDTSIAPLTVELITVLTDKLIAHLMPLIVRLIAVQVAGM